MTPELSVVIVSYECRDALLAVLGDLVDARSHLSLEVFVVDNASADGTVEAVRKCHPWVEVEGLAENVGFGRANNLAIRRARAETVLLLNPDTRVTHRALRQSVNELRRSSSVGILSPRVIGGDGRFERNCKRGFPTVWGTFCFVIGLDRWLRDRRSQRYTLGWLPEDRPADVEAVSGAVMFCRADALQAVGGFDQRFFMYGEDLDLCLRIAKAGWRTRYWPCVTVTHVGGQSGTSQRSRRAWAQSIGDLHRIHRPGIRGRFAGAICDLAGRTLCAVVGVVEISRRLHVDDTEPGAVPPDF